MNYLRNLLLTLTTVGAVLSFYIKVCRDFFIETIKFINTLSVDEIYTFATYGLIAFISLTFFIILNSMEEIAKTINENCTYIILTDTEVIACNIYLEYNEYYLVFRNGVQRYINKSRVKEINKSTYYYKQDFNFSK